MRFGINFILFTFIFTPNTSHGAENPATVARVDAKVRIAKANRLLEEAEQLSKKTPPPVSEVVAKIDEAIGDLDEALRLLSSCCQTGEAAEIKRLKRVRAEAREWVARFHSQPTTVAVKGGTPAAPTPPATTAETDLCGYVRLIEEHDTSRLGTVLIDESGRETVPRGGDMVYSDQKRAWGCLAPGTYTVEHRIHGTWSRLVAGLKSTVTIEAGEVSSVEVPGVPKGFEPGPSRRQWTLIVGGGLTAGALLAAAVFGAKGLELRREGDKLYDERDHKLERVADDYATVQGRANVALGVAGGLAVATAVAYWFVGPDRPISVTGDVAVVGAVPTPDGGTLILGGRF